MSNALTILKGIERIRLHSMTLANFFQFSKMNISNPKTNKFLSIGGSNEKNLSIQRNFSLSFGFDLCL